MKQIKWVALFFLLLQGFVHCVRADYPTYSFAFDYSQTGLPKYTNDDLNGATAEYNHAIAFDLSDYSADFGSRAIADYNHAILLDLLLLQGIVQQDAVQQGAVQQGAVQQGAVQQGAVQGARANETTNRSAIEYRQTGRAKYAKGDLKGAIAEYNHAIALEPKFAKAYVDRAAAKYDQGNFDGAIIDCDFATAIYPKLIPAYLVRGASMEKKGEKKKALADYEYVLQFDPENSMSFNNIAWIYATAPDPGIRNARKAVEYATKACQLTHWKDNAYFDTLAAAYAEAGDFDNALKFQSQYLAASPQNKEAQTKLRMYQNHIPYHEEVVKSR